MIDIYLKNTDDLSYVDDELEEDSELQVLISQIKMILFTNKTEVLGNNDLGLNLETLIFSTNVSVPKLQNIIKQQFDKFLVYDENKFKIDVDIEFYKGETRDIGVLKIKINNIRALDVFIR